MKVLWSKHPNIKALKPDDWILGRLYFQDLTPFTGHNIAAWLTLESDKLPPEIIAQANSDHISQIWCPSTFCKDNYIKNGIIKDKIRVVPHGVNAKTYFPTFNKNERFTFLFVGGYTGRGDRKGADILCEAFAEEFPEDDVELYLKINTVYGNIGAADELQKIVAPVADRVTINTLSVSEEELNHIYNLGHCFVSPSGAEGFNMTALEAMSCGLPVITTDYGGQMDYLPRSNIMIRANKFRPARYSPWDIGKWADIDVKTLRNAMRLAYDIYKTDQKHFLEMGRKNRRTAEKWSWKKAGRIAARHLKATLKPSRT